MSRAAWKGQLVIGALSVPVRMFNAGDSPEKVTFNQAHRCSGKTLTRLQQKRWCPVCKKEVPQQELTRVYEHAGGQYLEVTDQELKACEPAESTVFEVQQLLETPLHPLYIDSTALLVADGPAALEPFETIRAAVGARTLIGHLVHKQRHARMALQGVDDGLVVYTLRTLHQVRALVAQGSGDRPEPIKANVQHVRRALQELEQTFSYDVLRDHYGESVQKLVSSKLSKQVKVELKSSLAPKRKRRA